MDWFSCESDDAHVEATMRANVAGQLIGEPLADEVGNGFHLMAERVSRVDRAADDAHWWALIWRFVGMWVVYPAVVGPHVIERGSRAVWPDFGFSQLMKGHQKSSSSSSSS